MRKDGNLGVLLLATFIQVFVGRGQGQWFQDGGVMPGNNVFGGSQGPRNGWAQPFNPPGGQQQSSVFTAQTVGSFQQAPRAGYRGTVGRYPGRVRRDVELSGHDGKRNRAKRQAPLAGSNQAWDFHPSSLARERLQAGSNVAGTADTGTLPDSPVVYFSPTGRRRGAPASPTVLTNTQNSAITGQQPNASVAAVPFLRPPTVLKRSRSGRRRPRNRLRNAASNQRGPPKSRGRPLRPPRPAPGSHQRQQGLDPVVRPVEPVVFKTTLSPVTDPRNYPVIPTAGNPVMPTFNQLSSHHATAFMNPPMDAHVPPPAKALRQRQPVQGRQTPPLTDIQNQLLTSGRMSTNEAPPMQHSTQTAAGQPMHHMMASNKHTQGPLSQSGPPAQGNARNVSQNQRHQSTAQMPQMPAVGAPPIPPMRLTQEPPMRASSQLPRRLSQEPPMGIPPRQPMRLTQEPPIGVPPRPPMAQKQEQPMNLPPQLQLHQMQEPPMNMPAQPPMTLTQEPLMKQPTRQKQTHSMRTPPLPHDMTRNGPLAAQEPFYQIQGTSQVLQSNKEPNVKLLNVPPKHNNLFAQNPPNVSQPPFQQPLNQQTFNQQTFNQQVSNKKLTNRPRLNRQQQAPTQNTQQTHPQVPHNNQHSNAQFKQQAPVHNVIHRPLNQKPNNRRSFSNQRKSKNSNQRRGMRQNRKMAPKTGNPAMVTETTNKFKSIPINRGINSPLAAKNLWSPIENTGQGQPVLTNNSPTQTNENKNGVAVKTWFMPKNFDMPILKKTTQAPRPVRNPLPPPQKAFRVSGRRRAMDNFKKPQQTTTTIIPTPTTANWWQETTNAITTTIATVPITRRPRPVPKNRRKPVFHRRTIKPNPVQHPPVLKRWSTQNAKPTRKHNSVRMGSRPIRRKNNMYVHAYTTTTAASPPTTTTQALPTQPPTPAPARRQFQRWHPPSKRKFIPSRAINSNARKSSFRRTPIFSNAMPFNPMPSTGPTARQWGPTIPPPTTMITFDYANTTAAPFPTTTTNKPRKPPRKPSRRKPQRSRRPPHRRNRPKKPRARRQRRPKRPNTTTIPWSATTIRWERITQKKIFSQPRPPRPTPTKPMDQPWNQTPSTNRPLAPPKKQPTPPSQTNELMRLLRRIANRAAVRTTPTPQYTTRANTKPPPTTSPAQPQQAVQHNELLAIFRKIANRPSLGQPNANTTSPPSNNNTNLMAAVPPMLLMTHPSQGTPAGQPANMGQNNMQLLLDAMAHNQQKTESLNTIVMNLLHNSHQPQANMQQHQPFDPTILSILSLFPGHGQGQEQNNGGSVSNLLPEPRSCRCFPKITGCPLDKKTFIDFGDCGESEIACCDDN